MNIYCFSTLSFAKLQFKSVINKAFHKHGVASFTDAWIETLTPLDLLYANWRRIFYRCVDWNSPFFTLKGVTKVASFTDAWIETTLWKQERCLKCRIFYRCVDWNPSLKRSIINTFKSHLLQMRGLKPSPGGIVKKLLRRIFYRCVDWN